jgi:pimeloyl-ACP methyl ester carboxylesterase
MSEARIAYQAHGDGEGDGFPVVLLHGAAGTHLSWPVQVRYLPGCRVYALDLPGHGKSGGEPCRSIEDYARRLVIWMEGLDLSGVTLVGHSMGSAIAMQVALAQPHWVAALVLAGAAPRLKVNPALIELAATPETYLMAMERIVAWSFSRGAPQRLMELALKRMGETPQAVLLADLLACDAFDIEGRLDEIQAPALVVCGAEDRMTPLRGAQALAQGLRQGQMEVVADAGHMLMLEQPLAFAAILEAFIKGKARI